MSNRVCETYVLCQVADWPPHGSAIFRDMPGEPKSDNPIDAGRLLHNRCAGAPAAAAPWCPAVPAAAAPTTLASFVGSAPPQSTSGAPCPPHAADMLKKSLRATGLVVRMVDVWR